MIFCYVILEICARQSKPFLSRLTSRDGLWKNCEYIYTSSLWICGFFDNFTPSFVVFGKQKPHYNRNDSDTLSIHDNEHNNVSISVCVCVFVFCCLLLDDMKGHEVGSCSWYCTLNAHEMDHSVHFLSWHWRLKVCFLIMLKLTKTYFNMVKWCSSSWEFCKLIYSTVQKVWCR